MGDDSGAPSSQVKSVTTEFGGQTVTYEYTYDSNGNITSVSDGTYTTTYVYDSANQLVRESNEDIGLTWEYTYDDAGNILSKDEYAFTSGSYLGGENYTYGDSAWGDLLTKRSGISYSYDAIGNLVDRVYYSYTWEHGRELATLTRRNGETWTFVYDANGMRTSRTNGSTTYNYVYNGGSLSQMTVGSNTLHFAYDASGRPMSVTYNGTNYYYVLNLQGDVVAILNSSGTAVVNYTYDAWGSSFTTTGSMASTLGTHNPLRYRGYVYDTETGLYYVSSRYYDPEIGRWINADSIIGVDDILGNNLFAYCDNNPVNKVDYSGEDGQTIELGNGWYYRIDPQNTTTGTKRHIHIWNNKKEYIQNDDGSPHDKGRGEEGKIPKWLNNKLIEKAGWDYNGNRKSFFEETSCEYWVEGVQYAFADGTTTFRSYKPYSQIRHSIDSYECVYFQGDVSSSNASTTTQTFYLPIFGPVTLPSFSFGFGWGSLPLPLLY